jgi:hypothetical protein
VYTARLAGDDRFFRLRSRGLAGHDKIAGMLETRLDRARAAALFVSSFAALSAALFAAPACATRDYGDLGVGPPGAASSSSAGTGGEGGGGGDEGGGGGEGGEGGSVVEPSGPTKLTLVNGVNDYDAVRLCFLPFPGDSGEGESPWPPGGQGLAFAGAQVIDPIPSVIPEGSDVRTYVIGGNLDVTVGKTCAEVFDLAEGASPPVVVAPLPVLPKSVFTADKSLLLVTTGCLGGPGHTDAAEALACGASYTAETPNPGLVALGMSRIKTPSHVSLQAAHAAVALPTVDIRVRTGTQEPKDWIIAPFLSHGSIGPKPPFDSLRSSGFGSIEASHILTTVPGDTYPTSATAMSSIFAKSSIKAADFVDGQGFVLVAVGGYPGTAAGPWWHALTYALVRGDP